MFKRDAKGNVVRLSPSEQANSQRKVHKKIYSATKRLKRSCCGRKAG